MPKYSIIQTIQTYKKLIKLFKIRKKFIYKSYFFN